MNKETEKITNLLGESDWFDSVFIFSTNKEEDLVDYLKGWEQEYPNTKWLYHTKTSGNYCLIGVGENRLMAASEDFFDYVFHNKEEFFLVPFYLFSDTYGNSASLENMKKEHILSFLELNLEANNTNIYDYIKNMLKYIEWYKEQGYPMYEYIPKLEVFLKEQVEFWKDKFEK